MHIRQSIYIEATPARALEAARTWMRTEMRELDGEIVEGTWTDGSSAITAVIDQDGIRMTTSVAAGQEGAGSRLALDLRTQGINPPARIRNVGLLPGKRTVTRQALASLQEIKANAEQH